jgi:putative transposase
MQFDPNNIYHLYNRGNNSQPLFFKRENYLFFLQKAKTYITPYADILAWCLMPNHFHFMIYVNCVEITINEQVAKSHQLTKMRALNDSISIMLRSYVRAIQKQEKFTGSLFQNRTKSVCLTDVTGVSPAWFNTNYGTTIHIPDPEKEYPQVCFNYIHHNPIKSWIVKKPEDWEFSSYPDYCGLRNGKLINRERAKEFGLEIFTC